MDYRHKSNEIAAFFQCKTEEAAVSSCGKAFSGPGNPLLYGHCSEMRALFVLDVHHRNRNFLSHRESRFFVGFRYSEVYNLVVQNGSRWRRSQPVNSRVANPCHTLVVMSGEL